MSRDCHHLVATEETQQTQVNEAIQMALQIPCYSIL